MRRADEIMESGTHLGKQLIEVVKWHESQLDSDEEKLLWWASFMSYLSGLCAASIGTGALQAIAQMAEKHTADVIEQKKH